MSPTVRHASIPSAPLQSEPRLSESDRETELLLEHGRRGDRRALDELFGRHTERLRRMVRVRLDPRLREYIVSLVRATREPAAAGLDELEGQILYGASPRASIVLAIAARANAFLEGRDFATPGDVKRVAHDVMRHRVIPTYEAEAEGRSSEDLVSRVLETIPVP